MKKVTILIPTYDRPGALAALLTSLCFQTFREFDLVIADQSLHNDLPENASLATVVRLLATRGCEVKLLRNIPPQGMAQQRQFLLDHSPSPYSLFLDDDLILEPYVTGLLLQTIEEEGCGFAGCAPIGLSYRFDIRPHQQQVTLWEGRVAPETVRPGSAEWQRYQLHNAANIYHTQQKYRAAPTSPLRYKVAWVGGCVLYDTGKLREAGGFSFWKELPQKHCGEDVLAQLNVMEKYGGCGVMPSGVYHQELPTTIPDREINAPEYLNAGVRCPVSGVRNY